MKPRTTVTYKPTLISHLFVPTNREAHQLLKEHMEVLARQLSSRMEVYGYKWSRAKLVLLDRMPLINFTPPELVKDEENPGMIRVKMDYKTYLTKPTE